MGEQLSIGEKQTWWQRSSTMEKIGAGALLLFGVDIMMG